MLKMELQHMMVVQLLNAYVSALRDYVYIVASYAYGVAFAIVGTWLVLMLDIPEYVLVATMCFMDLGIFIIAALLFRNIFLFFGRENYRDFDFLPYFSTKKIVFFTNLFYTLGLYIHNLIIWCGPMGLCLADTYYYQPPYDTSTFYAYISILPAMMLFIVATETNFYDKYKRYLMFITDKGNYKEAITRSGSVYELHKEDVSKECEEQYPNYYERLKNIELEIDNISNVYNNLNIYTNLLIDKIIVTKLETRYKMNLEIYFNDGSIRNIYYEN